MSALPVYVSVLSQETTLLKVSCSFGKRAFFAGVDPEERFSITAFIRSGHSQCFYWVTDCFIHSFLSPRGHRGRRNDLTLAAKFLPKNVNNFHSVMIFEHEKSGENIVLLKKPNQSSYLVWKIVKVCAKCIWMHFVSLNEHLVNTKYHNQAYYQYVSKPFVIFTCFCGNPDDRLYSKLDKKFQSLRKNSNQSYHKIVEASAVRPQPEYKSSYFVSNCRRELLRCFSTQSHFGQ